MTKPSLSIIKSYGLPKEVTDDARLSIKLPNRHKLSCPTVCGNDWRNYELRESKALLDELTSRVFEQLIKDAKEIPFEKRNNHYHE